MNPESSPNIEDIWKHGKIWRCADGVNRSSHELALLAAEEAFPPMPRKFWKRSKRTQQREWRLYAKAYPRDAAKYPEDRKYL